MLRVYCVLGTVFRALLTLLHVILTATLQSSITMPILELTHRRRLSILSSISDCKWQAQRQPCNTQVHSLSATSCCMLFFKSPDEWLGKVWGTGEERLLVKWGLWSKRALGVLGVEYCQSKDQIPPTDLFDDLFANMYYTTQQIFLITLDF